MRRSAIISSEFSVSSEFNMRFAMGELCCVTIESVADNIECAASTSSSIRAPNVWLSRARGENLFLATWSAEANRRMDTPSRPFIAGWPEEEATLSADLWRC